MYPKQNVNQDDSDCATHCRLFALSHPSEKSLVADCHHANHSMSCLKCNALLTLLDRMDELLESMKWSESKEEWRFDLSTAKTNILS